ncbi:FG-GAP repeat domain-containing protein [Streptacidiphilus rugosus]|uniref:FG-GAP repeat domain-containing protein n=1 Tax=Streptacidiphilus rugosus TaxID=405783 RepID=UPI0012FBFB60|nr:VCBS repeat-containing protein [Streptacidiphilus rugosus]
MNRNTHLTALASAVLAGVVASPVPASADTASPTVTSVKTVATSTGLELDADIKAPAGVTSVTATITSIQVQVPAGFVSTVTDFHLVSGTSDNGTWRSSGSLGLPVQASYRASVLTVDSSGAASAPFQWAGINYRPQAVFHDVAPGSTTLSYDHPDLTVTGRLTTYDPGSGDTGQPWPATVPEHVWMTRDGLMVGQEAPVAADGTFTLTAPPGEKTGYLDVVASGQGGGTPTGSELPTDFTFVDSPTRITLDHTSNANALWNTTTPVTGTAQRQLPDGTWAPLTNSPIQIAIPGAADPRWTTTDANGRFQIAVPIDIPRAWTVTDAGQSGPTDYLTPASAQYTITSVVFKPANQRWNVLARDTHGALWQYQGAGGGSTLLTPRTQVGTGWNIYTALTSLNGQRADGTGNLVARDTTGVLWLYQGTGNPTAPFKARVRVGSGWNAYTAIIGVGDITGDRQPDLVARDSTGVLWLYQGTGNPAAPFKARVRVGSGWNAYTAIIGVGDITGDRQPDLVARDSTGVLWLYQGTGNPTAPFKARVRVGSGWNAFTQIVGVGDLSGLGHPGLIARDTTGALWYYQGSGRPSTPFETRLSAGGNWNTYTALA